TATRLSLRSRSPRTCVLPNTSKQPMWTPPSSPMGSPASIRLTYTPANSIIMSAPPVPTTLAPEPSVASIYCTSLNPSARSNSSARYCGATQIEGSWINRMRVVSDGSSAFVGFARRPTSPAAPADDSVVKKRRRLCTSCMTPPVPRALGGRTRSHRRYDLTAIRINQAHLHGQHIGPDARLGRMRPLAARQRPRLDGENFGGEVST